MWPEPRPELRALKPVPHGGDAAPGTLDFSTGVSPLPAPPAILAAAREADLARYPHPTAGPLRTRLAALHGVTDDSVAVGCGSVELIWTLARAFGGPGRHALVLTPSFGEYAQAVRASGGLVHELAAQAPTFELDPEPVLEALQNLPALAFICRPSNPCLSSVPLEVLEALVSTARSTLFVLDEAYLPMFDGVVPASLRPNVVVLRSLTKVFALPGLRLGYLLASPEVATAVRAALPPWNVSSPAQAAGLAAIDELNRAPALRREIAALREDLQRRLASPAVPLDRAGGPFLLYRVGDAASFTQRLLEAGCRVRDCSSFGLPAHVRVGVRPEAEQAVLAHAWHRLLSR